jgi:hypothetical protein
VGDYQLEPSLVYKVFALLDDILRYNIVNMLCGNFKFYSFDAVA